MRKRKYTRGNEKPIRFECTKRTCKWQGKQSEQAQVKDADGWTDNVCPKCGNDEFYGLLE